MSKNAARIFCLTLAAWAACGGRASGEAGRTAAPSLNAPLGARAAAMGQAFTGVPGGGESLNYNPGALAFVTGFSVTASYMRGFADTGHGFIAAPLKFGHLVLTPAYMHFNGGDLHLNLTGGVTGKVNAETDSAVYASGAYRIDERLGVGLTAKRASVELAETVSASAMLYDLGALYSAGHGLTLGAAWLNTGGSFRFENAGDPAPAVKRLGAAWRVEINPPNLLDPSTDIIRSDALFTADWSKPYREQGYWQAGAELNMEMALGLVLSLRSGYLFDRPAEGLTFGFGLAANRWTFDFSFGSAKEMNSRQQAGVSYKF